MAQSAAESCMIHSASIQRYFIFNPRVIAIASWKLLEITDSSISFNNLARLLSTSLLIWETSGPQQWLKVTYGSFELFVILRSRGRSEPSDAPTSMSLVGVWFPESSLHRAWESTHPDSQFRAIFKHASDAGSSTTFRAYTGGEISLKASISNQQPSRRIDSYGIIETQDGICSDKLRSS